jgi:hypothetical protein
MHVHTCLKNSVTPGSVISVTSKIQQVNAISCNQFFSRNDWLVSDFKKERSLHIYFKYFFGYYIHKIVWFAVVSGNSVADIEVMWALCIFFYDSIVSCSNHY